ncbi:MAG TPA: hypothetical protein VN969_07075 [Streptosporangiaceae bacterium]|nr:hypothetical protein [Streptosporangiaceae bacterium]
MSPPPDDTQPSEPGSENIHAGQAADVQPADLRILLGPRDRRRFANWGDRSYSDPSMLAGRPRSTYVHVVALCLAALADVGAFFQIVELVMRQQQGYIVLLVVLGFTATVLYVAHATGILFRDRKAEAGWGSRVLPYICALIWLGLGLVAMEVRLRVLAASTSITFTLGGAQASSAESPTQRFETAILFLALYVATGLVAGVGAYLSHNPLRDNYATATRAYRKASEQLAATTFQAAASRARTNAYQAELEAAAQTLEHEVHARLALAEELKQVARVLVAQRLKDPAVTDAIFTEDWRPYPPPNLNENN